MNAVAAVADISKDFLRTFCILVTYRFKVVLFGPRSSPFLPQKTFTHHLETSPNPLPRTLISHFYMNNLQITYGECEELRMSYPRIYSILADASMSLHGWISNNSQFNEEINLDTEAIENVGVLGLV